MVEVSQNRPSNVDHHDLLVRPAPALLLSLRWNVVLPTPAFAGRDNEHHSSFLSPPFTVAMDNSVERRNPHDLAVEPGLHRLGAQIRVQLLGGLVGKPSIARNSASISSGNRCGRTILPLTPATDARPRSGPVDMDGAARDDFGARADRPQHLVTSPSMKNHRNWPERTGLSSNSDVA